MYFGCKASICLATSSASSSASFSLSLPSLAQDQSPVGVGRLDGLWECVGVEEARFHFNRGNRRWAAMESGFSVGSANSHTEDGIAWMRPNKTNHNNKRVALPAHPPPGVPSLFIQTGRTFQEKLMNTEGCGGGGGPVAASLLLSSVVCVGAGGGALRVYLDRLHFTDLLVSSCFAEDECSLYYSVFVCLLCFFMLLQS